MIILIKKLFEKPAWHCLNHISNKYSFVTTTPTTFCCMYACNTYKPFAVVTPINLPNSYQHKHKFRSLYALNLQATQAGVPKAGNPAMRLPQASLGYIVDTFAAVSRLHYTH